LCGIAGIVKVDKIAAQVKPDTVDRMIECNRWRGPDANGVWHNNEIFFGHNRLSIIDLSVTSNQPMTDCYANTIVFNGEIYNYKELWKELQDDYHFVTKSDTEVILAAYKKWGKDCVSHFNGEWAFALFDKSNNEVFLSRDRYGIKPFYYTIHEGNFYFASEIRSILAAGVKGKTTPDKIALFLKYRQIEQRTETLLNGFYPLEPGTSMFIDMNEYSITHHTYYKPDQLFSADIPKDEDEAAEAFGSLLSDSVRLRLNADVPVQIMLSGGLDSSAITALASEFMDVKTLAYVSPGNPNDESYYSDMVAKLYETTHQKVNAKAYTFYDNFNTVIDAQDFPTFSEKHVGRFMLYQEAAKESTVILEGQGGDEVFGGYDAVYKIFREEYAKDLGVELKMHAPKKLKKSEYATLVEMNEAYKERAGKSGKLVDKMKSGDSYRDRQYVILRNNLLALLHTGDRLQMYHSIEGRYPLLDHRVVEFGMSMPVSFKMQEYDKHLLRKYLDKREMLPKEVLYRTDKKGFSTSLHDYLLSSVESRDYLMDTFKGYQSKFSDIFDLSGINKLINEQYNKDVDNVRKLLSIYSLMRYLDKNNISY